MNVPRAWTEVREEMDAKLRGGELENRLDSMVYEAISKVDNHLASFIRACKSAEEELRHARESAERYRDGESGYCNINHLGILQGRNLEIDRHAALLQAAQENFSMVARLVGVETMKEED